MSTVVEKPIEKQLSDLLPALQNLKDTQLRIVEENPFVAIKDHKSYEAAKKARTALVSARTAIQGQDKVIATKIKSFRDMVADKTAELIAITKPHEDKQQEEVKRYEAEKEAERQEKIRQEEERKEKIMTAIREKIGSAEKLIEAMRVNEIDGVRSYVEKLAQVNTDAFEEFELQFNAEMARVRKQLESKANELQEKEAQRVENERLQREREELEAERKRIEAENNAEKLRLAEQKREIDRKNKEEADRLAADRKKLEDEKAAIAKAEADRKAAEEDDRAEAERKERERKEAEEAQAKAAAEKKRLAALRPDMEKAIEYLESIAPNIDEPKFKDAAFTAFFDRECNWINAQIEKSIQNIQNYK